MVRVAETAGCTPAQALLAWGLARGLVVLPKSTRRERLEENLAALDIRLPDEGLHALDSLEAGLVTGWDPRGVP